MACNFLIEREKLQKAMSLANKALPHGLYREQVLMEIRNKEAVLKMGGWADTKYWLEQVIPLEKVDLQGSFIVPAEAFTKIKYSTKYISFEVNGGAKVEAGTFQAKFPISNDLDIVLRNKPKDIEIKHQVPLEAFANGLNFLAFDPIGDANKGKFVRLIMKDKKVTLMTHDNVRGAFYEIDNELDSKQEDLDVTFEISPLKKALSFIKEESIGFGISHSDNVIRVCCSNIDLYFPFTTKKIQDIRNNILEDITKEKLEFSFKVNSREIVKGIEAVSDILHLASTSEIPIMFDMKKEKNNNHLKLETKIKSGCATNVILPIYDLNTSGIEYSSSRLLDGIILMDGLIQFDWYSTVTIIRSLDYNMQIMLPKLEGFDSQKN